MPRLGARIGYIQSFGLVAVCPLYPIRMRSRGLIPLVASDSRGCLYWMLDGNYHSIGEVK